VLGVSATGASLEEARAAAYLAASKIRIQGAHYRTDIGLANSDAPVATGASGAAS
jgi:phosphoribosylamine-glycine ligase